MAMNKSTLGLIETYGFIGAVAALDTAAKAANIELVSCEFVKGGIVTILITGEVASVRAAVDASAAEAERLGVLLNTHVIARADENVWKVLNKNEDTALDVELDIEIEEEIKNDLSNKASEMDFNNEEEETFEDVQEETEESEEDSEVDISSIERTREELEKLKVTELRTLARQMKETYKISLTKKQIKFSKKEQLIEAILKAD